MLEVLPADTPSVLSDHQLFFFEHHVYPETKTSKANFNNHTTSMVSTLQPF
jgi:hypothetical protein